MSSLTSPSKHYKYITSPGVNPSTPAPPPHRPNQSYPLVDDGATHELDTPVTPTTPYRTESDLPQHSTNNTNTSHYIDIDDKPLLHQRSLSLYSNYQSDSIHAEDVGAFSDSATHNIIDNNRRINKQLYNKFPKKLRRNITDVNRKLQQFKRIKKHKLYNNSQKDNHLQLYNSTTSNTDHNDIMYRVSSFCVADSYELTAIIKSLENDSSLNSTLTLYSDVLQIKYRQYDQHNNSTRLNTAHNNNTDCFIFTYGCIIFWNYSESAETEFINKLRQYEIDSIPVTDIEMEEFDWCYGMKYAVQNDEITLSTMSSLEKLSLSFALAQNVKLSVYEERIAREIEKNSELPMELVRNGKINLSRKDIVKRIGGLFIVCTALYCMWS